MERAEKQWPYIALTALYALFAVLGMCVMAAGAWMLASFNSCRRTFVCNNFLVPPSIMLSVGLVAVIVAWTMWRLHRRTVRHGEWDIRNPRGIMGVLVFVVGTILTLADLYLRVDHTRVANGYALWLQAQDTMTFVAILFCDIAVASIGAGALRSFYARDAYPYL